MATVIDTPGKLAEKIIELKVKRAKRELSKKHDEERSSLNYAIKRLDDLLEEIIAHNAMEELAREKVELATSSDKEHKALHNLLYDIVASRKEIKSLCAELSSVPFLAAEFKRFYSTTPDSEPNISIDYGRLQCYW
jgi:hypothetical protein